MKAIILLAIVTASFPMVSSASSLCGDVFSQQTPSLSPKAKSSILDALRRADEKAKEQEQKNATEAALRAAQEAKLAQQKMENITAELESVKTLHDWNQISNDARLYAIEINSAMLKNLAVKSSADGREKDVQPGTYRISISKIKNVEQKEFAQKMLQFMKQSSEVANDRRIYVEILTTQDGAILGGSIRHELNKNESVEGYFDGAMTPLKFDESAQYDH